MVSSSFRLNRAVLCVGLVAIVMSLPLAGAAAPDRGQTSKHVVSPGEMRSAAAAAPAVRQTQVDKLAKVIDSEAARRELARWGLSAERAKAAVSRLDDSELAYLAARADGAFARLEGEGKSRWLIAGIAAAVVLAICAYLLATTEY
jgi:hypothetical protein